MEGMLDDILLFFFNTHPRELIRFSAPGSQSTDNTGPDEAEKGLLRTSPLGGALVREGSLARSGSAEWVRKELPQWLVA
jgi:hypothetical protein